MANDGEERLVTLFADIHYWFGQPSARPASHRFDKECYVYLYRNANISRGRLEVANHAGTPEQDAFEGYLDNAEVSQSHRHPTLVTITVDGFQANSHAAAQSTEWRLPSTDPRDEGKYLFRLHTLDIYFWTADDATMFVQHCQHTLKPQQMKVDYPVAEPHHDVASPVVQKLENMAVSDPTYGSDRRSATTSVVSNTHSAVTDDRTNSANYTPLAYNPAAPAAPEKIAHREKTPPPPEDPAGGLSHAANDDHHQQYHPGQHASPSHQPYTGIPTSNPSHGPTSSSHGHSQSTSLAPNSHLPLESPTAQIIGTNYLTSPTVPLQHIQPQYPDYLAQHQSNNAYQPGQYYPSSTGDHDLHSQVYRPSEEDGFSKPGKPGVAGPGVPGPGRWEQKAEKAEKGLNRLLRKVEKKIG